MLRRTFLTGVAAIATGSIAATESQAATWFYLGKRKVNGLVDFDQIDVGASQGQFDKIRLKVTGNDLMIYDLNVRYGNGADDDLPVRLLIPQGGYTRAIDLRANNRFIPPRALHLRQIRQWPRRHLGGIIRPALSRARCRIGSNRSCPD